jgi:hypothetical protein
MKKNRANWLMDAAVGWLLLMTASTSYAPNLLLKKKGGCNYAAHPCGSAGNSCYSTNPNGTASAAGVAAIAAGCAQTPLGKKLTLVSGNGTFKVWKEATGTRILHSTGLDEWQQAIAIDGRSFTGDASTATLLVTNIAGRACPKNVFISTTSKVATGRCVYYDQGTLNVTLNAAGTSQTDINTLGLPLWNTSGTGNGTAGSWYEGNIKLCALKAMRLPTLYEGKLPMAINFVGNTYPTDSTPAPSTNDITNGVPSLNDANGLTFTASALIEATHVYWGYDVTLIDQATYTNSIHDVRCVVQ